MTEKSKKKKTTIVIIVLVPILLCVVALQIFFLYLESFTTIESGFSDELVQMMAEHYSLNIPRDAEFIEGKYDIPWAKDFSVHIVFSVDEKDFEEMFSPEFWEEAKYPNERTVNINGKTVIFPQNKNYTSRLYTYVYYTLPDENGKIFCKASLRYPPGDIIK